ncbi:MAG: DsrE family protein [Candidatus Aquicultor sp.]
MKFGIIINSNDPETVWNAFRFALQPLTKGDEVRIFLTGKGVEADIEDLDTEQFPVSQMKKDVQEMGGEILCCVAARKSYGGKLLNRAP